MDRERVFAVSFGAYVGCLLGPAGSLVLPGPRWPVTAAGFLAAGVVGYLLARELDLAANLIGIGRNLSLVVFPFVYVPRLVSQPPGRSPVEFFAVPATVGLSAFLLGIALVAVGAAHRNRTTIENATVHAEFEARLAPRARKWQTVAATTVVCSGFLGGAVMVALGGEFDPAMLTTYVAGAMGGLTPLFASDNERDVAVTDAGLKVQTQVHDWDTFDDYDVTDDALVLERPKRRHSTFKFDRDDVTNLPDVEDALARYLPRE